MVPRYIAIHMNILVMNRTKRIAMDKKLDSSVEEYAEANHAEVNPNG